MNFKSGKSYIGTRVREEEPFNYSDKYTFTLAILGDVGVERWINFEQKIDTGVSGCYDFILVMLVIIVPGTHQRRRLFTMADLLVYNNRAVIGSILQCRSIYHVFEPRCLIDGAVKHVSNTVRYDLTIRLSNIINGRQ